MWLLNKPSSTFKKYPSLAQFFRFCIVGGIGAVVDFGSYAIITRLFNFWKTWTIFGQQIIVANMVSVFLAITSNFFWNKYWAFKDASKKVAGQWLQFFVLNSVTYILNQLLVSLIIFHTSLEKITGAKTEDIVAKIIAVAIILFLNFAISKFIVFRKKS